MEAQVFFRLKAGVAPCTVLQLMQTDLEGINQQLTATVRQAPDFFQGVPVVIDLEKLHTDAVPDFPALKSLLLENGLIPVGIRHGNDIHRKTAVGHGLPEISAGKLLQPSSEQKTENNGRNNCARLVTSPVRSGSQVYAREGDLVVVASVSAGAELLAAGNIHVYGPLRGRALAGVQGNQQSRIFCTKLEAELISIAGFYLTKDDMQQADLPEQGMFQIFLDGEELKVELLSQNN